MKEQRFDEILSPLFFTGNIIDSPYSDDERVPFVIQKNIEGRYRKYVLWAASRKHSFNHFISHSFELVRQPETLTAIVDILLKCINVISIHLVNRKSKFAFYDSLKTKIFSKTNEIRVISFLDTDTADVELEMISKSFPELQKLTLGRPCTFSDKSVTHFAKLESLKELCLAVSYRITDRGILSVSKHCRHLEKVRLIKFVHLTDKSLTAFENHELNFLEFYYNKEISEDGVKTFVESNPQLEILHLRDSTVLSMACIKFIWDKLPNLVQFLGRGKNDEGEDENILLGHKRKRKRLLKNMYNDDIYENMMKLHHESFR
jgi:hypothetical protein